MWFPTPEKWESQICDHPSYSTNTTSNRKMKISFKRPQKWSRFGHSFRQNCHPLFKTEFANIYQKHWFQHRTATSLGFQISANISQTPEYSDSRYEICGLSLECSNPVKFAYQQRDRQSMKKEISFTNLDHRIVVNIEIRPLRKKYLHLESGGCACELTWPS